ncbi:MAG: hypothetical protein JWQ27_72 [Ferruginibacter sp.]|nr:hypothetical protein [Ferruginibacter sp.]
MLFSCRQVQVKDFQNNQPEFDSVTNIYSVASEDPSMNAAIDKARKTIHEFDKAFETNDTSCTDFAVKKRYKTPDDGGEHMWVAVVTIENGNYKGIINNEAQQTKEVKYGDTVLIQKNDITDWMYVKNNLLKGGFTLRALRVNMNKEERITMDKSLGFKIED